MSEWDRIQGPYTNDALLNRLRERLEWTERNRARTQDLVDVLLTEECKHAIGWPDKKVAKAIKRYRGA